MLCSLYRPISTLDSVYELLQFCWHCVGNVSNLGIVWVAFGWNPCIYLFDSCCILKYCLFVLVTYIFCSASFNTNLLEIYFLLSNNWSLCASYTLLLITILFFTQSRFQGDYYKTDFLLTCQVILSFNIRVYSHSLNFSFKMESRFL